ncbi:mycofactocin-coupled SDR family oxidoreductase [Frankia sp. Ag45/Mut15]|uniref:Mycofactocin-coupled SDR family oxidoreductase n=1 Tax=Frankia umida TaxID=573489 RepID=A0ABT0K0X4_9ACTN|nr:mycofactocin-coupled SDR family oxidoreductase [Frankia umida]MCK9876933.1 mycofactocin-coupled SDR family oxidoreductase [Frankia umida]
MSERLSGRVAMVTGAARGQGRAEAVALAAEGADIIGVDACAELPTVPYPPATEEDLAETGRLVTASGARFVGVRADVRDLVAMEKAVAEGVGELGGLDVVVANAGISTWGRLWELTPQEWNTMIDVNLTGVWHTLRCTVPVLIEQGRGGSIVLTGSVGASKALPGMAHYVAAKHGLVGLARTAAVELGAFDIRVNCVHPWGVDTPMVSMTPESIFRENPQYGVSYSQVLKQSLSAPEEIARAVVFLASDDARSLTGVQLPVDRGATLV